MISHDRRSIVRSSVIAMITVSIAALGVSRVCAQSGEDIARQLIRGLIESRLEKERRKLDPFRPPETPGQPTPQVQQLQTISATYAQEANALSAVLNTDARRDYRIRRYLPAAFQFEATASAVRQQTASARNHLQLVDNYRQLNSEWLTLSYQLRNQPGVSRRAIEVLDRMDRLDGQYCALLQIQSQFDSRRLARAADLLSAELRHLGEELRYGTAASARRSRLIRRLQRQQQQADYFADLVSDSQRMDVVVQEYRRLYQAWESVKPDLDRYSNRSITRRVQRVASAHRTIHGLLRLDFGLDKRLVLHLVRDIETTMNELFQRITLADLMSTPDSSDVTDAADTAYGTLQHFTDVVQNGDSREETGEAWGYLHESWELLAYHLRSIQNPRVQHHLEEITGELTALRETLGVAVLWDPGEMARRASALESMAEGIHQAIRRWHRSAGVSDANRVQDARELISHCHELEQLIMQRRPPADIREECDHVTQSWQHLRPYLSECDTAERETLEQLAAAFTPELVRILTSLPE